MKNWKLNWKVGVGIVVVGAIVGGGLFWKMEKGAPPPSPPTKNSPPPVVESPKPFPLLMEECKKGKGDSCVKAGEQLTKGEPKKIVQIYLLYQRGCKLGVKEGCKRLKRVEEKVKEVGIEMAHQLIKLEEKIRKSPKFPSDLQKLIEGELASFPVSTKIWEREGGYILGVEDNNGTFTPCVSIDITEITIVYSTLPNGYRNPVCKWIGTGLGEQE